MACKQRLHNDRTSKDGFKNSHATVFHMFKKPKERLHMLYSNMEEKNKKTQIELLELKTVEWDEEYTG